MSQVSLSQQLKEGNLFAEQCPSREVLKHVTSRWGVLILVALREGTHRFSDLRRKIGGVSEKMLAQSLQALEQDGFLNRIAYPVVPAACGIQPHAAGRAGERKGCCTGGLD